MSVVATFSVANVSGRPVHAMQALLLLAQTAGVSRGLTTFRT